MAVYLIHFEQPYRHARHYLGYAEDVEARLARHRSGLGARLLAVIAAAGIGWTLARTWPDGDRSLKRRLKNRHAPYRLCPICQEKRRRLRQERRGQR